MIAGVWIYSFGASMIPLLPSFNGFVLYKWSLSCILDLRGMDGFRTKYYSAVYNTLTFLIAGISISVSQVSHFNRTSIKALNLKCCFPLKLVSGTILKFGSFSNLVSRLLICCSLSTTYYELSTTRQKPVAPRTRRGENCRRPGGSTPPR